MITAIVLAAGKSERMGSPKMSLPWGETTVIGQVVATLVQSGLDEVRVVTGAWRDELEAALGALPSHWPVASIFNPLYASGEMLSSIQAGIASLDLRSGAALIALGDQPQMEGRIVRSLLEIYRETGALLVLPSYRMRRGHPMLLARPVWDELLALRPPQTLRDLLQAHQDQIVYLNVDTPSILEDVDTPEDYKRLAGHDTRL